MDIGNRFSLVDFLAYLFPGLVGTLGVYLLLLLTPLNNTLKFLSTDLATGAFFLIVSFILGVVFSGFSEMAVKWRAPTARAGIKSFPFDKLEKDFLEALRDVLGLDRVNEIKWSTEHFYLCRSLVFERMQNCAQLIQRQSGLRQLRMNLTFPLLIWVFAGIAWGVREISNGVHFWGIILLVGSVALALPTFLMIVNRMNSNERREVREIVTAFLIGYKTGMFDKPSKDKQSNFISSAS